MTEAKDKPAKPPVRIFEGELLDAEFARTVHTLTGKPGTVAADYLEPEAWAHVNEQKLRQGARIEITAEDGTWFAELLVRVRKGAVIVLELLRECKFDAIAGKEHDAYDIEWAGPKAKWRVLRKSDRAVMVKELATKSEAVQWIEDQANLLKQAA